jgi:hypothetical protein
LEFEAPPLIRPSDQKYSQAAVGPVGVFGPAGISI